MFIGITIFVFVLCGLLLADYGFSDSVETATFGMG